MYATLVGCRELLQLDALEDIVEGDSFCAVQWGSAGVICPWRLADWVEEEVQYISRQLRCSFSHVLSGANGVVDELAREGVFD